jgi:tetratricopeptide (TPR) repeat protein
MFHQAQRAGQMGEHAQATDVYRTILRLYPGLTKVSEEYARSLEAEGKYGKAIEARELLYKQNPTQFRYALELGYSYDDRGWRKKAIIQFKRSLEIDKSSARAWLALVNCHTQAKEWTEAKMACLEGLEAAEDGWDKIFLYIHGFIFSFDDNIDDSEKYLKNILRLMRGNPDKTQNIEKDIFPLVLSIMHPELIHLCPYVEEITNLLPHMSDELRKLLAKVKRDFTIEDLEEKGFSNLFHDLFILLENDDGSKDDRNDRMAMEYIILAEKESYRPQLLRLQKDYPELYKLHETFFNEVMRTHNTEKMMEQRSKVLAKQHLVPTGYQNEEEVEEAVPTIRRTEPKTGRNDPCPCGSGKKYKHCHGR